MGTAYPSRRARPSVVIAGEEGLEAGLWDDLPMLKVASSLCALFYALGREAHGAGGGGDCVSRSDSSAEKWVCGWELSSASEAAVCPAVTVPVLICGVGVSPRKRVGREASPEGRKGEGRGRLPLCTGAPWRSQ